MSDEKKVEEGLTDDELAEITGGAGTAVPIAKNIKVSRTSTKLPNGTTSYFMRSEFGSLPGGGTTYIR